MDLIRGSFVLLLIGRKPLICNKAEQSEDGSDEWKVVSHVEGSMCEERSDDELKGFLEERRYGMLFILCEEQRDEMKEFLEERRYGMLIKLSPRFSVLLSQHCFRFAPAFVHCLTYSNFTCFLNFPFHAFPSYMPTSVVAMNGPFMLLFFTW